MESGGRATDMRLVPFGSASVRVGRGQDRSDIADAYAERCGRARDAQKLRILIGRGLDDVGRRAPGQGPTLRGWRWIGAVRPDNDVTSAIHRCAKR